MTRTTSIEAFASLARGGIGEQQYRVYEIVKEFGPLTQFETYRRMSESDGTPELSLRASRHSELVDLGYLIEAGERNNPSGHRAILYEAVPNPPLPPAQRHRKSRGYKQKYEELKIAYEALTRGLIEIINENS